MPLRRTLVSAILLVLAVLIELTVLAPLPFPGATPNLVLVVVVILASQFGAVTGAVSGFAGGVLLDIAPPAAGTIGITALMLTVVGYAVGRFAESDDRPWWSIAVLAALAAPLVVLGGAVLGGLLGDPRVRWDDVVVLMLSGAACALILGLLLIRPLRWLCRRVVPDAYPR
ncbi:MAG: rod shape-determining protein MreD [Actinobacteria bacterium]|nr:rod shape-determining protein MreD [Actinomycetota bacterium]